MKNKLYHKLTQYIGISKQQNIKKMGLKKGQTNNRKGRTPGSLNKITKELRQSITEFLENNFDEVVSVWVKLEGKDKLNFYRDLLKFAVPTLQATELTTDFDKMTDDQLDRIINELKDIATNGQKRKN